MRYDAIIALVALMALLAIPASAYTVIDTYDISETSAGAYLNNLYGAAGAGNPTTICVQNLTKIEFSGKMTAMSGFAASDSIPVWFCFNGGCPTSPPYNVGTGTLTWSGAGTPYGTYVESDLEVVLEWESPESCNWINQTYISFVKTDGSGGSLIPLRGYKADTSDPDYSDYDHILLKSGTYAGAGEYVIYGGSSVVEPVADFYCNPTYQYPDYNVVCNDTSTNTPTDWLWTVDADYWGVESWQTSTSQNFTWTSHYPGLFSVNLRANNSAGYDWYNQSDLVTFSVNATPNSCDGVIPSGYVRSMFQCVDTETSSSISGCNLNLNDQEGSAWSNITGRFDGTWCIDTLPSHHITGYGSMTGYSSAVRTDLPASGTLLYELLMVPGYVPNATAGKVWVYTIVNDIDTGNPLSNAYVQISGTGQATRGCYTNSAGQCSLEWANLSTAYITASKSGYVSATEIHTTSADGPDNVRIELRKSTVTATPTSTVPPGGVTTAQTVDPLGTPDENGNYPSGYSNAKGAQMMGWLAANGMSLVQLCFFVTILALLGVKFGK